MRQIALAALISVLAIPAQGATLTTTFSSNTGQSGSMFNILVGDQDIKITGFDLNLKSGLTVDLEWYILAGGHDGFEQTASAWTQLYSTSGVISSGTNTPTFWDVPDTIFSAGQTYGFYITTTTLISEESTPMRYTRGTAVGNIAASNTALTIYEGLGVEYLFRRNWEPRIWNGTIHYETMGVSPVPLPAAGWLLLAALGALGFAGYRRRDRLPHAQA